MPVRSLAPLLLATFLLSIATHSHAASRDAAGERGAVIKGNPLPAPGAKTETQSPDSFVYEFGRPIEAGEETYVQYRAKHADEAARLMGLDPKAVADGMDTWHWWVGVDNPGFWQDMVKLSENPHNYTGLHVDLLHLLATVPRRERFKKIGLINDPDAVAADKPDQFGFKLDRMKDGTLIWDPDKFGYSSGVIGIQLFKNEKFDRSKWSMEKYLENPPSVEPPYKVGMACIFCHIGFNPQNPPVDPAEPKWSNVTSSIGNQYLREGMAFGQNLPNTSFVYQYLESQEPGTSETSRFPMDFINNPTNINSIFRLSDRLKVTHVEKITPAQANLIKSMYHNAGVPLDSPMGALGGTAAAPTLKVPHILTDGADSMGVLMASVRVYVNEGLMHSEWYNSWPVNPFNFKRTVTHDFQPQEFDIIGKWRKDPNSPWMQTERRMPNMATFLESYDSFPLSEALEARPDGPKSRVKDGKSYLTEDQLVLNEGKTVFAENCASCHSSKSPENMPADAAGQARAWRELVLSQDFLKGNYLSDDARHSVLEVGTNTQRAEGTNAQAGSTWGQMSSQTYKDQRKERVTLVDHDEVGNARPLYNPVSGKYDIHFETTNAFYRTPTLVSIWATAPYLHNNSVGTYNGDPSVKGRVEAFEDGMDKLLNPEKRLGVRSIKVTTVETSIPEIFPELKSMKRFNKMNLKILQMPKGTPINLIMNLNVHRVPRLIEAYIKGVLNGEPRSHFDSLIDRRREAGIQAMMAEMVKVSTDPDYIEDRGHNYGTKLSDREKHALTEYMKYF